MAPVFHLWWAVDAIGVQEMQSPPGGGFGATYQVQRIQWPLLPRQRVESACLKAGSGQLVGGQQCHWCTAASKDATVRGGLALVGEEGMVRNQALASKTGGNWGGGGGLAQGLGI